MVAWQGEETRQVLTARDDAGRDFRTQGQIAVDVRVTGQNDCDVR